MERAEVCAPRMEAGGRRVRAPGLQVFGTIDGCRDIQTPAAWGVGVSYFCEVPCSAAGSETPRRFRTPDAFSGIERLPYVRKRRRRWTLPAQSKRA